MSIVSDAFAARRACRAEYDLYLDARVGQAERDCNGAMLNADGRRERVDARSLFYGSYDRALRYASDELAEWWRLNGRTNYAAFERQWSEPV